MIGKRSLTSFAVTVAFLASKEVLRNNREGFTVKDAKDYSSSTRSAYSMANAYCGAAVDTFCESQRASCLSQCGLNTFITN
jgi:hypothetical protein